jgi:hypothetical protein
VVDASCPAPAVIESLLLGLVSADEASLLESHASDCPHCPAAISRARAEDQLVRACRRAKDHAAETPDVARLMPKLKQLFDTAPTGTYSPDATTHCSSETDSESLMERVGVEIGGVLGPFQLLEVLGRDGSRVPGTRSAPRT